ncbi:MAG TPA: LysR family transcriptional regulator [Tepidisphaeraceae bacterium]|jgi:DNA-binding transcriptional LysR family regulator
MELRQLVYFEVIAEESHFGRASERLHVAQPALTRQIQQLERELGVQLFDRSHRRIRLTEAGHAFLEETRRLLAGAEQAKEAARRAARGETGRLTVAFVGSATYGPLPLILRAFRERFPSVHLLLDEMDSSAQSAALLERRVDVGFLRTRLGDAELAAETLLREPIVAAIPQGHPLAKRAEVPLADLAGEPFVLFHRSEQPSYADVVLEVCAKAGFRPRLAQEATEVQTAIGLVGAGFGVCLVPEAVHGLRRAGVVYRPLRRPVPMTELVANYRRDNRSPALREFLNAVRTGFARHRPPALPQGRRE